MKVQFKHKLLIRESRVMEIFSLIGALINPNYHEEVIDLSAYKAIKEKHQSIISVLSDISTVQFGLLEMALLVSERDSTIQFFHKLEAVSLEKRFSYFLGNALEANDLKECLADNTALEALLKENKLPLNLMGCLSEGENVFIKLKALALDIDDSNAFNEQVNVLKQQNAYDEVVEQFTLGMKVRHPLSFAQELMGKLFWNIADYQTYEFIVLYFLSPYRLRCMDSETMIYFHSLKRRSNETLNEMDVADLLKKIADPTRLKILHLVYSKPMYGKEIADSVGLTTATVSHHLDVLRSAGLIHMEQVRQIKYFSTNHAKMKELGISFTNYVSNKYQ